MEKKKRWRPSLGAYRALENEVSALREQLARGSDDASGTVSMLVADCDAWREKYRRLKDRGFWSRLLNRDY